MNQSYKTGIIFSILSSLFLALTAAFAKEASASLPVSVVLLARFFICLVMILPVILVSGQKLWVTNRIVSHILRSILGFSSIACFFYSLRFIHLANALILSYTIPLFVPFLLLIFYKTKISYHGLSYLIIGFVGVSFIIHPQHGDWNFFLLLALASGLFGAAAMLSIRELSETDSAFTIMFYYYLFSSAIALSLVLFSTFTAHVVWHFNIHASIMLLGVGIMGALYQLFLTYSLKLAPAQVATPFLYISVVFSFLIEWLMGGKMPNTFAVLGILLATFGAIMSSRINRKQ